MSTSMSAASYQATQTEAEFQKTVVEAARTFGWLVTHMRQMLGNEPGIPDLLMWRDDDYLLIELKTDSGVVSPKQKRWHENAAAHGVTVHVWRPSSWDAITTALSRP